MAPQSLFVDDSVCEKTKPSSRAASPMQGASYHHSHLKGKQVYGHSIVQTLLRSGDVTYPLSSHRYEPKGKSKIQLVCDMIGVLLNQTLNFLLTAGSMWKVFMWQAMH